MRRLLLCLSCVALVGTTTHAQEVYARDGWEAFPRVEYQGGDATQPKKRIGMLVLTEDRIALHPCLHTKCFNDKKRTPFEETPYFSIALSEIRAINTTARSRSATAGERFMAGAFAGGKSEGFVGIVYETPSSMEAPTFKTPPAVTAAIDAKIRFRMKKLGIEIPPASIK